MSDTTQLVTAEELERFPEDDFRGELVEGRVVRMTPVRVPARPYGRAIGRDHFDGQVWRVLRGFAQPARSAQGRPAMEQRCRGGTANHRRVPPRERPVRFGAQDRQRQ